MKFQGFRSVDEYVSEANRVGFLVEKRPWKDNLTLLTTRLRSPSNYQVWSWDLLDEPGGKIIADGSIWGYDFKRLVENIDEVRERIKEHPLPADYYKYRY